jgi:hypothetical protein
MDDWPDDATVPLRPKIVQRRGEHDSVVSGCRLCGIGPVMGDFDAGLGGEFPRLSP